eukprot:6206882-Pleurochrysis_carterae.AAC.1
MLPVAACMLFLCLCPFNKVQRASLDLLRPERVSSGSREMSRLGDLLQGPCQQRVGLRRTICSTTGATSRATTTTTSPGWCRGPSWAPSRSRSPRRRCARPWTLSAAGCGWNEEESARVSARREAGARTREGGSEGGGRYEKGETVRQSERDFVVQRQKGRGTG